MRKAHNQSRRHPGHLAWLAAATGGTLLASLLVTSTAHAAEPTTEADFLAMQAQAQTAQNLTAVLGADRTAGIYQDGDQITVAVTDEAAAQAVRDIGGIPELVQYSTAELTTVHDEIDHLLVQTPGVAWGVDASENVVTIDVDSTVSEAGFDRLVAATDHHGTAIRIERVPGEFHLTSNLTYGGMGIQDDELSKTCSLGFNVRYENDNSSRAFLTAGHCADDTRVWRKSANDMMLGQRLTYSWATSAGLDYAIIDYTNPAVEAWGTVRYSGQHHQITSAGSARDGESVQRTGAKSTDLRGAVLTTSDSITVWDPDRQENVTVRDMIKTSHCAKNGDSGGPLFYGSIALGLTSITNTPSAQPCHSDVSQYRTWFQPIDRIFDIYTDLDVY